MNYKYKKTEIGEIPAEWEVSSIGKHLKFKNGLNKEKEAFGHGTPIINYTDVYKKRALNIEDIKGKVQLNKEEIKRYNIQRGDILFTRTSETKEEVGLSAVILDNIEDCVFSGFLLRGRQINNSLDLNFCKYCFSNKYVREKIINESSITTRALTNGTSLTKIQFPLPTKKEQEKIGKVLTNIDNEIETLEKIIKKKQYIKETVIKQIFNNSKSIHSKKDNEKGFIGKKVEWKKVSLGEICDMTTGHKDVNEGNDTGIYPFFTCSRDEYKSNSYSFDMEAILVAGNGEVGNLHYYNGKFEAYQRTYVLYNFRISIKYVLYFMNLFLMKVLKEKALGTTIGYIVLNQLKGFEISVPKTKIEIETIVDIIDSFESELVTLNKKLSKLKNMKITILNDLITGKRRLLFE